MAIPEKKQTGWGLGSGAGGETFLKILLELFIFLLYPWKLQAKQRSTSGNSKAFC